MKADRRTESSTRATTTALPPEASSGAESLAGARGAFEAPGHGSRAYAPGAERVGRDRDPARHGAARWVLVLGVGILLALGLVLASGLGDRDPEGSTPGALAPARGAPDPRAGHAGEEEVVRIFDRDEGGLAEAPTALPAGWQPDFDGQGSIRGRLVLPEGLDPVPALRVSAKPSRILRGRDRARASAIELPAGETEFVLSGLPLGGYDLEVEGEGLQAPPHPVLLVKGSADPYVVLALSPTGFIDGFVRHADGRPAEGVQVTLEPLLEGAVQSDSTGASGEYLFLNVRDGEYRISFGPPEQPLLPARELFFRAPMMQVTPQVLPPLVELHVIVVDEEGRRVEAVTLDGYGSNGGHVHALTDLQGEARIDFLPPGNYRVSARAEDGRHAQLEVELGLDPPIEHTVRLRP